MSELLITFLSLSLSGTILMAVLYMLKLLYKNRISKAWQYYIWIVIIARLWLPLTPDTTPVGWMFSYLESNIEDTITNTVKNTAVNTAKNTVVNTLENKTEVPTTENTSQNEDITGQMTKDEKSGSNLLSKQRVKTTSIPKLLYTSLENLWIIWLTIAFALLIRKVTMYQSFVKYIKAGQKEVEDINILNLLAEIEEELKIKTPIELYTNSLISSPMLIGFFRPFIVLPNINFSPVEMKYIMKHELIHFKRRDMFYKWLVQITLCLHWFNPFIHRMGREIANCCELSCDEVIVKSLRSNEKRMYGDTLLASLKSAGKYRSVNASVTLTENSEQIKERLDAIMIMNKKSKLITAVTIILTIFMLAGATGVGAYAAPIKGNKASTTASSKNNKIIHENGVYYILYDGASEEDKPASSVTEGYIDIVIVDKEGYSSVGPFRNSIKLIDEVTKQCNDLLNQNYLTQEEAKLVIDLATKIQLPEKQLKIDIKQVDEATSTLATPWSAMGKKGEPYNYKQSAYYQDEYIFELGWNLNKEGYKAYTNKAKIKLSDKETMTISFDDSCKEEAKKKEVVSALTALMVKLTAQSESNSLSIEKPLVVSIQYADDKELEELAKEYYKNDELTRFSAIFFALNYKSQQEFCNKMFHDDEIAFFSSVLERMDRDLINTCAEKAYKEDKITFFSELVPYLSDKAKKTWIAKASKDDRVTFLSELSE
jgi:beta-lactamase regulating signal transducer with metallopeptidase domain